MWEKVWDEALSLAENCSISVTPPRPRRTRTMPQRLEDGIVDCTIVTSRETATEDYRTQVYYTGRNEQ